MGEKYMPVAVEAARLLAEEFGKDIVVVLAIDWKYDKTHVTTYGRQPRDKSTAATFGDWIGKQLAEFGCAPRETFEDFRTIDAGKRAKAIELLRVSATEALSDLESGGKEAAISALKNALAATESM